MDKSQSFGLNSEDLDLYTEYIKLALSALYPISKHWQLSGKLAKAYKRFVNHVTTKALFKVEGFLPQLEIGVEK